MELSFIKMIIPHEAINIKFQQYLLHITGGKGNFIEFANGLTFRSQLGMIIEFLDVCYNITIMIVPNGGAVIKVINDRQYIVDVVVCEKPEHPLNRYYMTIECAFNYITKPF